MRADNRPAPGRQPSSSSARSRSSDSVGASSYSDSESDDVSSEDDSDDGPHPVPRPESMLHLMRTCVQRNAPRDLLDAVAAWPDHPDLPLTVFANQDEMRQSLQAWGVPHVVRICTAAQFDHLSAALANGEIHSVQLMVMQAGELSGVAEKVLACPHLEHVSLWAPDAAVATLVLAMARSPSDVTSISVRLLSAPGDPAPLASALQTLFQSKQLRHVGAGDPVSASLVVDLLAALPKDVVLLNLEGCDAPQHRETIERALMLHSRIHVVLPGKITVDQAYCNFLLRGISRGCVGVGRILFRLPPASAGVRHDDVQFWQGHFDNAYLQRTQPAGKTGPPARPESVEIGGVEVRVDEKGCISNLSLKNDSIQAVDACGVQFTQCTFHKVFFNRTLFVGAKFVDCQFIGCQIQGADFSGATFESTDFESLDVSGTSFARARFVRCFNAHGKWSGVDLTLAELHGCEWENVAIQGTLSGLRLQRSTCTGLSFAFCDMPWTSLSEGSMLVDCSLIGADLRAFACDRKSLSHCCVDTATKLPASWRPAAFRTPEDVLRPGSTLLVRNKVPGFLAAMVATLEGLGIQILHAESCQWPRDFFSKSFADGGFTVHVAPEYRNQQRYASPLVRAHRYHSKYRGLSGQHLFAEASHRQKLLQSHDRHDWVEVDTGVVGQWPLETIRVGDGTFPTFKVFLRDQPSFVPGGNMIVTSSGLCLIGEDSLRFSPDDDVSSIIEVKEDKVAASFPDIEDPDLRLALWKSRKASKPQMAHQIGVSAPQLVVIPQPPEAFHLDLFVIHVGGTDFIVDSYEKKHAFLEENEAALRAVLGDEEFDKALRLVKLALDNDMEREIVDVVRRKLEKHGQNVVTACCSIYSGYRDDGGFSGLRSMFANGLVYEDASGQRVYFAADAPGMDLHKAAFESVCAGLGVKVEFVKSAESPMVTMEALRGGLRCMTATNIYAVLNPKDDDAH